MLPTASDIRVLTPSAFNSLAFNGKWFVNFNKPDCPYSVKFRPVWKQLARSYLNTTLQFGQINCHKYRDFCKMRDIYYYPTLVLFEDAFEVDVFEEDLASPDIQNFLDLALPNSDLVNPEIENDIANPFKSL
ncbi:hypothetical protein DSO57_1008347 [Entomophthora muscae]|uniref:Uncharacterized protein n=1 Tax=Entomophthora muscae TaxID=34485 RepID=A0ACC2S8X5_9FUNG|nr:hypothetical protein DSO57_1008347 [Entomophthora muscae]